MISCGTMGSGVTSDYVIFRCTNLAENVWTEVGTQARHAPGTNTFSMLVLAGRPIIDLG